ncbi:MAG: hypothetical protein HN509_17190 [Halobacteriovoraceae bacterium]|nr:hypothetical protein [Halobacteriovoraceae bacterium]
MIFLFAVFPAHSKGFTDDDLHGVGLWRGHKHVDSELFGDVQMIKLFYLFKERMQDDTHFEYDFFPIINRIHKTIEKNAPKNAAAHNGVGHLELAKKIVKVSLCFGNDPYMVAAKLFMETRFDRSLTSPTGAVGFSQMTSIGIDEVNDQFQNRGPDYAPRKNKKKFKKMIKCFLGDNSFENMFEDKTIVKGARATKSSATRSAAKKWIQSSLDRDLIYGNLLLKTYAAANYKEGRSIANIYLAALGDYNGDTNISNGIMVKDRYAAFGLRLYDKISAVVVDEAI